MFVYLTAAIRVIIIIIIIIIIITDSVFRSKDTEALDAAQDD